MLELLFAFLEVFLEIFFEAAFEFAAEFFGALIWRGVAAVFDASEFRKFFTGLYWLRVLGRSRRWPEPPLVSASSGSSVPGSWPQCGHQSRPCGFGNVD